MLGAILTVGVGGIHQQNQRGLQLPLVCRPVQWRVAHCVIFVVVHIRTSLNQQLRTLYRAVVSGDVLTHRRRVLGGGGGV